MHTYLFDLDGTLIDNTIYAKIYEPILTMIRKKTQLSGENLDSRAQGAGLEKDQFGRYDTRELCQQLSLLNEYYLILEKYIEVNSSLHLRVITLLQKLNQQRKVIGIVSDSLRRSITTYMKAYRLERYVTFVFCAEDAGCGKDTLSFWTKLIEAQQLEPKQCMVVGDNQIEDVEMPRRAGFKTFRIKGPDDMRLLVF